MAKTLREAMQHAEDLVNDYADQKEMMDDVDKMYFMDWGDKPTTKKMKFTVSPSARNALIGAIRLMTSTEPVFSVPFDANKSDAKQISEKIEQLCKTIWYHSGRFRGVPLEQPSVESLLRYGMMVLAISDTEELRDTFLKRGASKAQKRQIERLVESTPYLIEAWDPKSVYPEWGRFGLSAVYRTVEMTVAEVIQQFGEDVIRDIIGTDNSDLNERVQYADYWDLEKHMAWISSTASGGETIIAGRPIVDELHKLPCIPIVIQTSEGSYLDSNREYQAIPFLYAVLKSELWERQNLELSYLYTNLFYLAANPTFIHRTVSETGDLETDYDTPGGRIILRPNEDFHQLQKDVINKDMMQGLEIANDLMEESTIFTQALGGMGGLGANAAFSTVSLLHQAGRLPLVSPQKRGGWGIGSAMEIVFEMIKEKGKRRTAKSRSGKLEFDPKDIPDDLIIEAKLDIDLPQDMLNQVNVAGMITQAGLASRQWVRENILNIGQSDEMDKEIWSDMAKEMEYQKVLLALQQQERAQPEVPTSGQAPIQNPRGPGMQTQAGMIPGTMPGEQPTPSPLQESEL